MFVSAITFEKNLRKLGKTGLNDVSHSFRARSVSDVLGRAHQHFKERFNRPSA